MEMSLKLNTHFKKLFSDACCKIGDVTHLPGPLPTQGLLLYRWTEHSTYFFEKMTTGGGKKARQITPQG